MNIKEHRFFILLYLFLFCLFTVSADAEANDRYLVIIVMDGCRADYLDLQPMPSLEELKKNGVYYSNAWVGLMMNNTPTAHAAIQTGLDPVNNGIIGFFWKDAASRKKRWVKPSNWDNVLEGAQLDIMKLHSAFGFIGELKKKYPDFLAASVSGHKFYAAETFGGPSCDVIAFPFWGIERRLTEEQKQYGAWNTLLSERNESSAIIMYVKDRAPSSDVLNDPVLKTLTHNFGDDESAVALALSIFKHQRPKALLINLPRLDHLGHFAAGGYRNWRKNIGEYMKTVDTLIGRIVDEYKKAGLFEKTVFIVLADHGMATNGKTISPEFIRKKLGKKATSSAARQHRSYIWSFNISEETLCGRAENLAKSNVKYLRAIYIKRKNDGMYSYKLIPYYTDRIEPRLDEVYRFLLNTHANASSPDLYLIPWENTLFRPSSYKRDINGMHDSPTWRVQHIPLLISGPGIKKGLISDYPARLVDIAPTILELFNISNFHTDGIILADAIINTRTENLKRQEEMGRIYKPYIEILKKYSDEDLKQIYPEFKDPTKIP